MSTALVTGATGFIGTHLVRRLLNDAWSVAAVVRPTTLPDALSEDVRVVVDDGSVQSLTEHIADIKPDICFHLATNFVGVHKPTDVNDLVESNVAFGARLAEACSTVEELAFVNVGTVWQHHDARPYGPTSLYAATKQAFQDIAHFYAEVQGLRVVNLELADTYGPHDPRRKLVQLLMETAMSGNKLEMSPGEQLINLVHVDDVLNALLLAPALASTEAPAYGVPSAEPMNLQALVKLVETVIDREVPVVFGARPYRPREMMTSWQYAPTLPAWSATISLRDGLTDLWNSLSTDLRSTANKEPVND